MMDLYRGADERDFFRVRVAIFAVWALKLLATPLEELSLLPASAYASIGIPLKYVPAFILPETALLSPIFLLSLKWATFMLIVTAVTGPFRNVSAVLACALLTVIQSLIRGFGFINHAEIPLLYAAYVWTAFSFFRVKDHQAPFILFLTAFLLTYTFIAAHRIAYGGIEVFQTDRITYWIAEKTFDHSSYFQIGWGALLFQHEWLRGLFKAGFPVVTAVELLAPLALLSRPFRAVFLAVIYSFHLLCWLFMDLFFWESMLILVLLFDLSRLSKSARQPVLQG